MMGQKPPFKNPGQNIQYDTRFHGPTKNRSCTDIICLLLFLVFIVCWIVIGIFAVKKGDPQTLFIPRNSQGLRCGFDEIVKDKPYLFFFDITKCLSPSTPFLGCDTPQICVEKCPSELYIKNASGTLNTAFCSDSSCPAWYVPSESFSKRCIPKLSSFTSDVINNLTYVTKFQGNFMENMKTCISNIKLLSNAEQVAQQVISDVVSAWWKILIGVVLALVACIIYILMLRWVAGVMVWISIFGIIAGLGAALYFSTYQYIKWRDNFKKTLEDSDKTKRDIFLGLLIIVSVVLAIVLLILIFLRKRIVLAIALIKEGSKAVGSVTSVLFFPIFPWVLQIGVVAYAVCVGAYLATMGDPLYNIRNMTEECSKNTGLENYTVCSPTNFTIVTNRTECSGAICKFVKISNEAYYPYLQALNVFGFFWMAFFVSALGEMVLAQVFARWYWTIKKSTLPFFAVTSAFYTTIRYHLGTLAFGSLIIAICRMIRLCLEYVDRKLKKYDNQLVKALLCCLKCFFWCLEKFLKFINKNAYIMCAIHGKNFCTSAKDAFMLLMRNILRVFVLDKITDFLFFLSKLVVTFGVGAIAYLFFATDMVSFIDNSNLKYGIVPVIIIMIATYLIASLFFSVYSMAVDTLFLCFLEDIEKNDGKTRPYFMSRSLMKIFGKRNKGPKND